MPCAERNLKVTELTEVKQYPHEMITQQGSSTYESTEKALAMLWACAVELMAVHVLSLSSGPIECCPSFRMNHKRQSLPAIVLQMRMVEHLVAGRFPMVCAKRCHPTGDMSATLHVTA
jgi:hypothetical protein